MAEFTKIEKQLLKHVNDDRLCESLSAIRQAVEDIWASDAPRLIRDFTDHGIKHSERIAGLTYKLLQANIGKGLSVHEAYLLLAGIYLHDIGMQCDVVNFPEIRKIAESQGAKFDIEFTSQTTSNYSFDEQKAIRKNHQYLSAAWIDYAFKTSFTVLGLSAKTIPDDLVDDLMDVCKYHAKLQINDCPAYFKLDATERKQFVAALLRFADELDIDGQRVSIEVVKNFNLDPLNSMYWWLHNLTKVIFRARNLIEINIRLDPINFEKHSSFIQTIFIDEIRKKNALVIEVLAKNDTPIIIGEDSKVVKHDHAEQLPPEIDKALYTMEREFDQQKNQRRNILTHSLGEVNHRLASLARTLSACEKLSLLSKVVAREPEADEYKAISRAWEKVKKEYREIQSFSSRFILERQWNQWTEISTQLEMAGDAVDEAIVRQQKIIACITKYSKVLSLARKKVFVELQNLQHGNQPSREENADDN